LIGIQVSKLLFIIYLESRAVNIFVAEGVNRKSSKKGFNKSGTQKVFCKECGAYYTDDYENLVIVSNEAHVLIHAKQGVAIEKYLSELQLNKMQIAKLNKLRKLAENSAI
jgi:hypothetical protein